MILWLLVLSLLAFSAGCSAMWLILFFRRRLRTEEETAKAREDERL